MYTTTTDLKWINQERTGTKVTGQTNIIINVGIIFNTLVSSLEMLCQSVLQLPSDTPYLWLLLPFVLSSVRCVFWQVLRFCKFHFPQQGASVLLPYLVSFTYFVSHTNCLPWLMWENPAWVSALQVGYRYCLTRVVPITCKVKTKMPQDSFKFFWRHKVCKCNTVDSEINSPGKYHSGIKKTDYIYLRLLYSCLKMFGHHGQIAYFYFWRKHKF